MKRKTFLGNEPPKDSMALTSIIERTDENAYEKDKHLLKNDVSVHSYDALEADEEGAFSVQSISTSTSVNNSSNSHYSNINDHILSPSEMKENEINQSSTNESKDSHYSNILDHKPSSEKNGIDGNQTKLFGSSSSDIEVNSPSMRNGEETTSKHKFSRSVSFSVTEAAQIGFDPESFSWTTRLNQLQEKIRRTELSASTPHRKSSTDVLRKSSSVRSSLLEYNKNVLQGISMDKNKPWEPYSNFYYMVQEFESVSTLFGRIIISERTLPNERKTIQPVTKNVGGIAGGDKYIHAGILFKFISNSKHVDLYGNHSIESASKAASHELKSFSMIAMEANREYFINYPLSVLIDYEGWRVLAQAILPVNGRDTLIYGSMDYGKNISMDHEASIQMNLAANELNLASHKVYDRFGKSFEIMCPVDMEIHRSDTDGLLYCLDVARLFPPEAPRSNVPQVKNAYLFELLRPELVRINSVPLSSDVFSPFARDLALEMDAIKLSEFLHKVIIPKFAFQLNSNLFGMPNEFCSSWSLNNLMHRHGINMRHLGEVLVSKYVSLQIGTKNFYLACIDSPAWKQVILIEMAARIIKINIKKKLRERSTNSLLGSPPPRKLLADIINLYLVYFNNENKTLAYVKRKMDLEGKLLNGWWALARDADNKFFHGQDVIKKSSKYEDALLYYVIDRKLLLKRLQQMLGIELSPSSLDRESSDQFLDESDIISVNPRIKHLGIVLLAESKAFHLRALENVNNSTSLSLLRRAVLISKQVTPESFSFLSYQGELVFDLAARTESYLEAKQMINIASSCYDSLKNIRKLENNSSDLNGFEHLDSKPPSLFLKTSSESSEEKKEAVESLQVRPILLESNSVEINATEKDNKKGKEVAIVKEVTQNTGVEKEGTQKSVGKATEEQSTPKTKGEKTTPRTSLTTNMLRAGRQMLFGLSKEEKEEKLYKSAPGSSNNDEERKQDKLEINSKAQKRRKSEGMELKNALETEEEIKMINKASPIEIGEVKILPSPVDEKMEAISSKVKKKGIMFPLKSKGDRPSELETSFEGKEGFTGKSAPPTDLKSQHFFSQSNLSPMESKSGKSAPSSVTQEDRKRHVDEISKFSKMNKSEEIDTKSMSNIDFSLSKKGTVFKIGRPRRSEEEQKLNTTRNMLMSELSHLQIAEPKLILTEPIVDVDNNKLSVISEEISKVGKDSLPVSVKEDKEEEWESLPWVMMIKDKEVKEEMEIWYSYSKREFYGSPDPLNVVAIKGSGKTFAFGGKDAMLNIYNLKTGEMINVFENVHKNIRFGICGLLWRPKGGWEGNHNLMNDVSLISYGHPGDDAIIFWVKQKLFAKGLKISKRISIDRDGSTHQISSVVVYHAKIYIAYGANGVYIYNMENDEFERRVKVNATSHRIVELKIFNFKKEKHGFHKFGDSLPSTYLLFASEDHTVSAMNLQNGDFECVLGIPSNSDKPDKGHLGIIDSIAIFDDLIATGGRDRNIILWRMEEKDGKLSYTLESTLRGHNNEVSCVKFCLLKQTLNQTSDPFLYLISCSMDCTIRLWKPTLGLCLRIFYTPCELTSFDVVIRYKKKGKVFTSAEKDRERDKIHIIAVGFDGKVRIYDFLKKSEDAGSAKDGGEEGVKLDSITSSILDKMKFVKSSIQANSP